MEVRKAFAVKELPKGAIPLYDPNPLCRCSCHMLGDGVVTHFVPCCRYTYHQYLIPKDPLYFCGFHIPKEGDYWISLTLLEDAEKQVQEFEQRGPQ